MSCFSGRVASKSIGYHEVSSRNGFARSTRLVKERKAQRTSRGCLPAGFTHISGKNRESANLCQALENADATRRPIVFCRRTRRSPSRANMGTSTSRSEDPERECLESRGDGSNSYKRSVGSSQVVKKKVSFQPHCFNACLRT